MWTLVSRRSPWKCHVYCALLVMARDTSSGVVPIEIRSVRCWRQEKQIFSTSFYIYIYIHIHILVSNIYIKLRELSFFKGIVHPKWKCSPLCHFRTLYVIFFYRKKTMSVLFFPIVKYTQLKQLIEQEQMYLDLILSIMNGLECCIWMCMNKSLILIFAVFHK